MKHEDRCPYLEAVDVAEPLLRYICQCKLIKAVRADTLYLVMENIRIVDACDCDNVCHCTIQAYRIFLDGIERIAK